MNHSLFKMELGLSVLLMMLISSPVFITCQDTPQLVIYLTDQGETDHHGVIFKANLHHMNFTSVVISNVFGPIAITYDLEGEQIYWTDNVTKEIRTADKDGGNNTVVAQLNTTSSPEGLTLDSNTRQVFYTDRGDDVIVRIEMDSFESTVIVDTGLANPKGIVADIKNRKLYWVDWGTDEKIESCDYDGGQRRTVVKNGVVSPRGITLDQETGRLYWADGVGHIDSILVDGSDRRRIFTKVGVTFNDVSIFNNFIYFTALEYPVIFVIPEDGSNLIGFHSRKIQLPVGLHAFSPNYNVKNACSYGRYGVNCVRCGRCLDGGYCEKTTGICLGGCEPGYQGELCNRVCNSGTYGEGCKSTCPTCPPDSICDHVTGQCTQVCGPNTYGDSCEDCGECAGGVPCHEETGVCPKGCLAAWGGPMCKTYLGLLNSSTPFTGEDNGPAIGVIVGVSVGVVVVIIAVVIIVAVLIVRRQNKSAAEPGAFMELEGQASKEYDNTTLGSVNTSGIMMNPEQLVNQSSINYSYS